MKIWSIIMLPTFTDGAPMWNRERHREWETHGGGEELGEGERALWVWMWQCIHVHNMGHKNSKCSLFVFTWNEWRKYWLLQYTYMYGVYVQENKHDTEQYKALFSSV